MHPSLPEEVLREILCLLLQVSSEEFSGAMPGRTPPFADYFVPGQPIVVASSYLLVCKDWLRVATPLLYNVIILRSKGQMRALEATVTTSPALAGLIRKLRIEGNYSASLSGILKGAIHLTELCLSVDVESTDDVSGLCKGLAYIRPRRLLLLEPYSQNIRKRDNDQALALYAALQEHIPTWESLTAITLPWYSEEDSDDDTSSKQEVFGKKVLESKSIQVVAVFAHGYIPQWLHEFADLPTAKKIILMLESSLRTSHMKGNRSELVQAVDASSKLQSLVEYAPETDGELEINFFDFGGYSEDGAFGTDLEVFLPDAMTKEILDLA